MPLSAWAAVLASAQSPAPSPARRCADAARGSEVEVCLRLAAENPDGVEEIASALIAHLDRAEAPDRDLLDALLLLATDRAPEGAATLGTLGDPRAVPVLVHLARTATPEVSAAAVAALSSYPTAIPVLSGWLRDRSQPLPLRLAVAEALGRTRRPEAADALQDSLRGRMPQPLRAEVARALAAYGSGPASPGDVPSTDGAPWLAVGASTGLAYAMGAGLYLGTRGGTTVIRQDANDLLPPVALWEVGAATGGVAGASLGWTWGRAWPIEAGDAALIATTGAAATASGVLIGLGFRAGDRLDRPLLGGLAGEIVGYGTGFVLRDVYSGTAADAVEGLAIAAVVAAGADELGRFAAGGPGGPGDPGEHQIVTGLVLAGGFGLGQALAPSITPGRAAPWVGTGAGVGLAAGLLAPIGDRDRGALPIATALLGAGAGAGVSCCVPLPPDMVVGGLSGGLVGAGVAGGLGLVVAPESPDVGRALAVGGLGVGFGVGAGIARVDPDPMDDRDVAVSVASAAWATWDVVAVGALIQADRPAAPGDTASLRSAGAVLLATGLAAGTTTALNLVIDVPVPHTLSATSIGLWGGYAGAAVGEIVGVDPLVLALPGSNLGLLGGALLMSPRIGAPPLVIAVADAFGAIGASAGATGAGLLRGGAGDPTDIRSVAAWSLGGAAVGLTAGALIGNHWHRDPGGTRRDLALLDGSHGGPALHLPPTSLRPLPLSEGGGVVLEVSGW